MRDAWPYIMMTAIGVAWALGGIAKTIVDGVVKTKQAEMQIEREYLAQILADMQEIKQRLEAQRRYQEERDRIGVS